MNHSLRTALALLAIPALLGSADALAACRVTQLSGEYLYSTTLRAENGEFFCHGAGAMTITGRSTFSALDIDKCTGESNRTVEALSGTYTFDQSRCLMTATITDPDIGTVLNLAMFFDSRGVKFRGVVGTNLMGISGSIEGERR